MSKFTCPIVMIEEVLPHPNADRLEIVHILGWQAVVQKGTHQKGTYVVYLPEGSVLPPNVAEAMGVLGMLAGKTKDRIKTIRLRGEISQGMVMPWRIFTSLLGPNKNPPPKNDRLGFDVSALLGITKYEAPIPVSMAGVARSCPEWFSKYTDIENIKNYPNILVEGQEVVMVEKAHGTNCRVGLASDDLTDLHVGSHNYDLVEDDKNLYWRAVKISELHEKLKDLVTWVGSLQTVVVYGEVIGSGVQKGYAYGHQQGSVEFRAFDIKIDGKYVNYSTFVELTDLLDIARLPELFKGPFSKEVLDQHTTGPTWTGDPVREGVVVRPVTERYDPSIGRIILKSINVEYLLKDQTEYH